MSESVDLTALRLAGLKLLCGLGALLALPIIVHAVVARTPGTLAAALLAIGLLAAPIQIVRSNRFDFSARMTMVMTISAMPALLLFSFQGFAWQVDLHMIFFAVLAIGAVLADRRATLAGAAVVAVHHLVFGMATPTWVFGTASSFGRIVLHAVVLTVETAALMWLDIRFIDLIRTVRNGQAQREESAAAGQRAGVAAAAELVVGIFGAALRAISQGDLTQPVRSDVPPAYATLKTDFNEALDKLSGLIGAVSEGTHSLRLGSSDIAVASQDLARRTESNAASLAETAASITKMEVRLKASAGAASRTIERANQAIATVGDGRAVADEAVQAMGRVADSAKGIDTVIEGLDKFAFQTRVLAMNAAVEAGRAGNAGRGFSVVADLVSALAMRAEEEAKRARNQLTVTQSEIVTAVEAVHRVDGSLAAISDDVTQVHHLVATMASDNLAQSSAITQITTAVGTMERITQQNATLVEQTSVATRNLAADVVTLSHHADRFVIPRPTRDTPRAKRARRAPALAG